MSNFPFNLKIESPYPSLKVGDLEIPAYGSLTVNESITLQRLSASDEHSVIGAYYADVIEEIAISRIINYIRDDSVASPFYALPVKVLEDAIAWVKKEQNEWQETEPETAEKKVETPTGEASFGDFNSLTLTNQDSVPVTLETALST